MIEHVSDWWAPAVLIAVVVSQIVAFIPRPKGDAPRIKRDFEAGGARVLSIKPAGFDMSPFRRDHAFRKYDIVVDHPFKGRVTYTVGVSISLFSDVLKTY